MELKNFKQAPFFSATPLDVYNAWLDSEKHAAMINGSATIDPLPGGKFTIWDGDVEGETIEADPKKLRIVQSWRYNYGDWPKDKPSKITLEFVADKTHPKHTRLRFWQSGVPVKYATEIAQGWRDFYWEPMQAYFSQDAK